MKSSAFMFVPVTGIDLMLILTVFVYSVPEWYFTGKNDAL
jgi:hypothetical protein